MASEIEPLYIVANQLKTLTSFGVLVYAAFRGPRCGGNPFKAATLEWQSSSPPDFHNFIHQPVMCDPYDFNSQVYVEELDSYVFREFTERKVTPDEEVTPQKQET